VSKRASLNVTSHVGSVVFYLLRPNMVGWFYLVWTDDRFFWAFDVAVTKTPILGL
jgi:hypothetical protein